MARELKVYDRFDELILYLRFVAGTASPYHVVEGTRELREAVWGLYQQDFDRTVIVGGEHRRFTAKWGSPDYVDALAGYWESNFRWRAETITDEFPIELRNTGLVPTNHSAELGRRIHNQGALAGGLGHLSSTGLVSVPMPKAQAKPDPYLSRLMAGDLTPPRAAAAPNGGLEGSPPTAPFPRSAGNDIAAITARGSARSNFGLAIGMVSQGGSAYGATFCAPG